MLMLVTPKQFQELYLFARIEAEELDQLLKPQPDDNVDEKLKRIYGTPPKTTR